MRRTTRAYSLMDRRRRSDITAFVRLGCKLVALLHRGALLCCAKIGLFTPGPTPLLPAAQFAMAAYTAHHRTADFRALYTRVLADMKEFIGTKNDVLVLACSGTGVMEASVSNLTSAGDKVLVLTAGKFGERWQALTKAFGCQVETLSKPYGQTFSLDEIQSKLDAGCEMRLCARN